MSGIVTAFIIVKGWETKTDLIAPTDENGSLLFISKFLTLPLGLYSKNTPGFDPSVEILTFSSITHMLLEETVNSSMAIFCFI